MSFTFGNRPEDVVSDSKGNVLSGVSLTLYATQADALAQLAPLATVSTVGGSWSYASETESVVWVRTPSGSVYPVSSVDATVGTFTDEVAAAKASAAASAVAAQNAASLLGSIPGGSIDAYVGGNNSVLSTRMGVILPAIVDHAGVQAALTSAVSSGKRVVAAGSYTTDQTLDILTDCDLSDLTITYTGTGEAVRVGPASGFLIRKDCRLPKVKTSAKTVNGWAQVAGTTGVLVRNCYNVALYIPYAKYFETGLVVAGYGAGTSYCDIDLGHLDNNKINMRFTADATGWANQNNIRGGRLSHDSNEGTIVAGTRHVVMDLTASKINNNNFFGTSLESPNVVEYHLDCAGNDNYFWGCRWENTGTGARIVWRANSIGNAVHGGFGSHTVVETTESNAFNEIHTRARSRFTGDGNGGAVLNAQNTSSSTNPIIRAYEAGTSLPDATGTAWAVDWSATTFKGKRAADTNDRVRFDIANGRLYFGNGSAATTRYIGNVGTSLGVDGANLVFVTDNTYDLGATSLRPRYIRVGTAVQTGVFATGSRPAAATAGAGASVFDSTLNKPIWSDGTSWRDATGTVV